MRTSFFRNAALVLALLLAGLLPAAASARGFGFHPMPFRGGMARPTMAFHPMAMPRMAFHPMPFRGGMGRPQMGFHPTAFRGGMGRPQMGFHPTAFRGGRPNMGAFRSPMRSGGVGRAPIRNTPSRGNLGARGRSPGLMGQHFPGGMAVRSRPGQGRSPGGMAGHTSPNRLRDVHRTVRDHTTRIDRGRGRSPGGMAGRGGRGGQGRSPGGMVGRGGPGMGQNGRGMGRRRSPGALGGQGEPGQGKDHTKVVRRVTRRVRRGGNGGQGQGGYNPYGGGMGQGYGGGMGGNPYQGGLGQGYGGGSPYMGTGPASFGCGDPGTGAASGTYIYNPGPGYNDFGSAGYGNGDGGMDPPAATDEGALIADPAPTPAEEAVAMDPPVTHTTVATTRRVSSGPAYAVIGPVPRSQQPAWFAAAVSTIHSRR